MMSPSVTTAAPRKLTSQVLVWLVQIPLITYAVHGAFSPLSPINGALAITGAGVIDVGGGGGVGDILRSISILVLLLAYPLLRRVLSQFPRHLLISAIVLLAFTSALWSQEPRVTMQKSVYLILTTIFAFYLGERFKPVDLMKVVMINGALAMLASLFLIVAMPRYGLYAGTTMESSGWEGLFSQKNILGITMVYFLLPALYVPLRGVRANAGRLLYIATALVLIVGSRSRGAWIMCACVLLFSAVLRGGRRLQPRLRQALYVWLGIILVAAALLVAANFATLLRSMGKDPTLTGRTEIWASLFHSIAKRPWFGFGYSAFWVGLQGESANTIYAINWTAIDYAENGFVELALEIGLVGVVLFLLAYTRVLLRVRKLMPRAVERPEIFWYAAILFLIAISNIESGLIAFANSIEWVMFVLVSAGASRAILEQEQPIPHAPAASTGAAPEEERQSQLTLV